MAKKVYFIVGIVAVICLLLLIPVVNIFIQGEILQCEYYRDEGQTYYDLRLYGTGRVKCTHYGCYKLPEESEKYRMYRGDIVTFLEIFDEKERQLSFDEQIRVLLMLNEMRFAEVNKESEGTGKYMAELRTFGNTYKITLSERECVLNDPLFDLVDMLAQTLGISQQNI